MYSVFVPVLPLYKTSMCVCVKMNDSCILSKFMCSMSSSVLMYVCMFVCMYIYPLRTDVPMYVCTYVRMYCMYILYVRVCNP